MAKTQLVQSAWQYPYDTYQELYLENTKAGHRKFYKMVKNSNGWEAYWGKIGTTGQTMNYKSSEWGDKLAEKIKKGYVLERADSTGATSKPKGTPVPVISPRKSDPQITVDAEVMTKLDRIILFLEERRQPELSEQASEIKLTYIHSGILTKEEMEYLNRLWINNGGGRW
jgi:predicted DNA-binding WGR domain protein